MLIGLNGRLKSGKDTTFKVIQKKYPFAERISFADPLKSSAAAALGIAVKDLEAWKNDEENIAIVIEDHRSPSHHLHELTVREYLQYYGTEAHREVFGDNFWIDNALPLDTDHSNRMLVVTDMRFPNEVQRVKDLGGICVKINRQVGTETKFGSHASEQNVDHLMDYFLDNNGNMHHLKLQVGLMFHTISNLLDERRVNAYSS